MGIGTRRVNRQGRPPATSGVARAIIGNSTRFVAAVLGGEPDDGSDLDALAREA